jgi:ABC-type Fe3+-hydroxamate transport system substrate-binding protein
VSRSKRNKGVPNRTFSDKLSVDEAEALKVMNPDDWFLTTKTIPHAYFKKLSGNDQQRLAEFHGKDTQAVKTLRTVKTPAEIAKAADAAQLEAVELPLMGNRLPKW